MDFTIRTGVPGSTHAVMVKYPILVKIVFLALSSVLTGLLGRFLWAAIYKRTRLLDRFYEKGFIVTIRILIYHHLRIDSAIRRILLHSGRRNRTFHHPSQVFDTFLRSCSFVRSLLHQYSLQNIYEKDSITLLSQVTISIHSCYASLNIFTLEQGSKFGLYCLDALTKLSS